MGLIDDILRAKRRREKAQKIENDPELREKSLLFGGRAIACSIISIITGCLAIFLSSLISEDNAVLMVIGLLFGIGCGIATLGLSISSLIDVVRQLKLNKRAGSWFALVMYIISLIAIAVFAFIFLFK